MLDRGVTPSIGGVVPEDYARVDGEVLVVDALTAFTLYTSDIASLIPQLSSKGVLVEAPRAVESQIHLLDAWRIRRGFSPIPRLHMVDLKISDEEPREAPITPLEASILAYAEREGVSLLSDDYRLRSRAREIGVRSYSSLSLITTYMDVYGSPPQGLAEMIISARAVPLLIPLGALEAWGVA